MTRDADIASWSPSTVSATPRPLSRLTRKKAPAEAAQAGIVTSAPPKGRARIGRAVSGMPHMLTVRTRLDPPRPGRRRLGALYDARAACDPPCAIRATVVPFVGCGDRSKEDVEVTEAAASLEHRSRLARAWAVLRGQETVPRPVRDDLVSFAEPRLGPPKRQAALDHEGEKTADDFYRRRLATFKGGVRTVLETYWCRYEASGVALTERERPRRLSNLFRRDLEPRFHTATDWRTAHANRVESGFPHQRRRWRYASARSCATRAEDRVAPHLRPARA